MSMELPKPLTVMTEYQFVKFKDPCFEINSVLLSFHTRSQHKYYFCITNIPFIQSGMIIQKLACKYVFSVILTKRHRHFEVKCHQAKPEAIYPRPAYF